MKKILIFLSIFILFLPQTFADETKVFTNTKNYKAYKENVANFCAHYYKNQTELIYRIDESKSFTNMDEKNLSSNQELQKAKKEYTQNLDNLYACANSITNYKSIQIIKEIIANNPKLNARLQHQLQKKEQELQQKAKKQLGGKNTKNN